MQLDMFNYECQTPYMVKKPIRLIELFGGIGSQAKALENLQANFTHYRLCEFDKYAVQSYNAIHGTEFETSDITKITAIDLGITDTNDYDYMLTYSFPCQDLSTAGKQAGMAKGSNTRSGLLWEVERLLEECEELPQILLMENVPQVLNCDFGGWLEFLERKGYHNYYKCLNAKNFGIPQNRDRCFMVSVLGNYYYDFPKEIPLKLRLKDMLESKVDEKYYLSEKGIKYFEKQANNRNETLSNIKDLKIVNLGHGQSKGSIQKAELFPTLDTRTSTAWHSVLFEPKIEVVAQLDGSCETAPTLRSERQGLKVSENYRIRKLTPKECWRLMGFTDSDVDKAKASGVSDSQLYKQAGNSIVVNVLVEVFKTLINKETNNGKNRDN